MERLKQKTALITGGASGIGKMTVEIFLKEGAKVICWDMNEASGDALLKEFEGFPLEFYAVNVADVNSIAKAAAVFTEKHGTPDILINNAGITRDATLKKMTSSQWQSVIDVNLTGVFQCTQAFAPAMMEKGSGVILNAASVVGLYGNFGQTNYVATKAGVIGMTKVWAREMGRKGVRVNAVAPGFIATEMVDTIPENVLSDLEQRTPLARLGHPEDIANAYLFLASDEASFITGTTLSVDGGLIL
ncbi:beta-ketoacyl-ACP reductase [Robertkochia solimangrovi]|uniref:beta-ketoacyl-ACP reductase n=1 Tax=Robertkochia solimangrovi TaxID=2213046 RepID=UPI00117C7050|nr:beta-ketoacyl-ACP reductase [Robertkochia solimangrovi]TRZ43785.1 3-oxoacyl-ACP reductase [Robertkochia solimangrovi]